MFLISTANISLTKPSLLFILYSSKPKERSLPMDINFELYKTFFYVVETGSFSGAALILYVTLTHVGKLTNFLSIFPCVLINHF